MTLRQVDRWAIALWEHYLPHITSGEPFYLAADRRLMTELYEQRLGGRAPAAAALEDFRCCCLELLNRTSARASLRKGTLDPIPGHARSRAICLAVQQVLIVEVMLNDEHYSESSYFPRYRTQLDLGGEQEHVNPLPADFQQIWALLAREIQAVPGATSDTITFSPGLGPDKNRNLPLSQALFTTHDLTIIRENPKGIHSALEWTTVFALLWHARSHFGGRAKRLIAAARTDDALAIRLAAQVQSFLARSSLSSELRSPDPKGTEEADIVAYLDRADWLSSDDETDRFSIYCRSGSEQIAGERLSNALSKKLSVSDVVLLVLRGDAFREASKNEPVDAEDTALAIVRTTNVEQVIVSLFEVCGARFLVAQSTLESGFVAMLCTQGVNTKLNAFLWGSAPQSYEQKLALEGGLVADGRSRTFLAGYPPTGIRHLGKLLSPETIIGVGSGQRSVGDFLATLKEKVTLGHYSLSYENDALDFVVAPRRGLAEATHEVGFVVSNGELELAPRSIEPGVSALRGTYFTSWQRQRSSRLSTQDLLQLGSGGKRIAVTKDVLALVLEEIQLWEGKNPLANVAARKIAATKSVPLSAATGGLLRRIQAAPPVILREP